MANKLYHLMGCKVIEAGHTFPTYMSLVNFDWGEIITALGFRFRLMLERLLNFPSWILAR